MRLIDANALLEKLSRMINYCKTDKKVGGLTALFQVGDAVMDSPSVDAVPVIRCKDCDNRIYINMGAEIGVVGGCCIYEAALPEDFYCAYGKRGD